MSRRKRFDTFPPIAPGTRPKVLLVGNGITLSFKGSIDTDKIITDEWNKRHSTKLTKRNTKNPSPIWKLPFPMQIAVATNNCVQGCLSAIARDFKTAKSDPDQDLLIREILDTQFDVILSTNYSMEFEKTAFPDFSEGKVKSKYKISVCQTKSEEMLGIYQCTELPYGNHPLLWHIHGTALRKKSLVMGQHYYGKLLTEVTKRADEVNKAYRSSQAKNILFNPLSWIDYFLIGDVYILGFGLDLSETDIWWLLSCKKTAFDNTEVNFYNPDIPEEKKLLLECYDVAMPDKIRFDTSEGDDKYINYYKRICKEIKKEH